MSGERESREDLYRHKKEEIELANTHVQTHVLLDSIDDPFEVGDHEFIVQLIIS